MKCEFASDGGERINLFSLVTYLPEPLGPFLDQLRRQLVPSCNLQAHVTILPPRPLSIDIDSAVAMVRNHLHDFSPFQVWLRNVEIFALTSVVYLEIGSGALELRRMHDALDVDGLRFNEPYPYHPHVTLAQQTAPEQVEGIFELARCRWAEFDYVKSFQVDSVTFVQATTKGKWIDLAECGIGTVASIR
jgi:2'-5' RNA ligase